MAPPAAVPVPESPVASPPAPEPTVSEPSPAPTQTPPDPEPASEPLASEPREATPQGSDYPVAGVTAAPPADPSLQGPAEDRFGVDPAGVLTHGYIVDSGAIPPPDRPTDPPPAFGSLGEAAATDPAEAFRTALDNSFAVRMTGTPFLVVAVRMEASAPESVYFPTVAEGLRSALRPQDRILVDENRRRAVVLLPASQADAAQDLFSGLQSHLRRALGDDAAGVLRAVGAVSVPDGQPFTSSRDLMAYAYED